MKRLLLFTVITLCCVSATFATIHKIKVADFQFSKKRVNALVGDTIKWIWQSGSHTTTSIQVPPGAVTWDALMNVNSKVFLYKVKKTGTYKYMCRFHSAVMMGVIKVSTPLAAGLKDFSVDASENAIAAINWKTGNDKDIAYYSVQRSTDGENFTEIARVKPAAAAAVQQSYHYNDNSACKGSYAYYTVQMVDKKGNNQLSEIKMIATQNKSLKLVTSLSPNPISKPGHLMLQFNAGAEGKMQAVLYDAAGKAVKQTEFYATKGLNNGHFHLGELTPGSYYLVCTLGKLKEKHIIVMK